MTSPLHETRWQGPFLTIASALLFGASTPVAKLLVADASPLLLAGLLYLGSGFGLMLILAGTRILGVARSEAPLRWRDWPWLALVVLFGGVVGPALLMSGLTMTPAASASLLLNTESLATMAIAWVVFRENVDRRVFLGAMAILAGAVVLSLPSGGDHAFGFGIGSVFIVGACLCWGIDNNLTRKLSAADPLQTTMIKGLAAGLVNVVLALVHSARLPSPTMFAGIGVVGFLGYGASLVLFVHGLRHLGAARTGAYFSTAPFVGALLSLAVLGEPVTLALIAGAALMGIGVYLHLTETHAHEHTHDQVEHEHRHVHDIHHQHEHQPCDPAGEPHSHPHRHAALTHKHPHYPDLHHRHEHA